MFVYIIFTLSLAASFMPTIVDIKENGKLNKWGKIYLIVMAFLFLFGIAGIWKDNYNSDQKEILSLAKNKSDSLKNRSDSILRRNEFATVLSQFNAIKSSDSSLRIALQNGGYKYDKIRGVIIPKVSIKVENGGRALQNFESNKGNQYLGDTYNVTNTLSKELSEDDRKGILVSIKREMSLYNLTCIELRLMADSNAPKFFNQLIDALRKEGYTIGPDRIYRFVVPAEPVSGVKFQFSNTDTKCLSISVGVF